MLGVTWGTILHAAQIWKSPTSAAACATKHVQTKSSICWVAPCVICYRKASTWVSLTCYLFFSASWCKSQKGPKPIPNSTERPAFCLRAVENGEKTRGHCICVKLSGTPQHSTLALALLNTFCGWNDANAAGACRKNCAYTRTACWYTRMCTYASIYKMCLCKWAVNA